MGDFNTCALSSQLGLSRLSAARRWSDACALKLVLITLYHCCSLRSTQVVRECRVPRGCEAAGARRDHLIVSSPPAGPLPLVNRSRVNAEYREVVERRVDTGKGAHAGGEAVGKRVERGGSGTHFQKALLEQVWGKRQLVAVGVLLGCWADNRSCSVPEQQGLRTRGCSRLAGRELSKRSWTFVPN